MTQGRGDKIPARFELHAPGRGSLWCADPQQARAIADANRRIRCEVHVIDHANERQVSALPSCRVDLWFRFLAVIPPLG